MDIEDKVAKALEEALVVVSAISSDSKPFSKDFDGILIGKSGLLDSLETVTLLINFEEKISGIFNAQIPLTVRIFEELNTSFTKKLLIEKAIKLIYRE